MPVVAVILVVIVINITEFDCIRMGEILEWNTFVMRSQQNTIAEHIASHIPPNCQGVNFTNILWAAFLYENLLSSFSVLSA